MVVIDGDPCKNFNFGSTIGATLGGAATGAGGVYFSPLGKVLGEGVATSIGAAITSGPAIGLPAIGGTLGARQPATNCGCGG